MQPRKDEFYMDRAIELAKLAISDVFPNPRVGAVIVSGGEIVGEGFHRGSGKPHAEIEAIAGAGEKAAGGTLYLNLEPCCHHGETPPCTDAIIQAGIARVVFGIIDPDRRVRGRGAEILRGRGIDVTAGVRAREAFELNYPFIFRKKTGRAMVTLKVAMTLDGKLTVPGGGWFTSGQSRKRVHYLRSYHEAVAVGIGTVLSDDPSLDRRYWSEDLSPPVRMVFDSDLRFPADSRWFEDGRRVLVYCRRDPLPDGVSRLEKQGAEVIPLPGDDSGLDLEAWRDDISRKGLSSVLVEGGAGISTSLLREGLVDIFCLFTAARVSGEIGLSWYGGPDEPEWMREGGLSLSRAEASGEDVMAVFYSELVKSHFDELRKDG
ncbi:MAG: bifunctional diaminohydroxyphosphoribosylaminopyrimidine deaminase/5-amino-6-(5-phosphoribosylamino)uracil reductase RibD [Candidatus Krumholzibacteriales bacterium]